MVRGVSPPENEATPYITEFLIRMGLSKIGFTQDMNDLNIDEAMMLSFIGSTYATFEIKETQRKQKQQRANHGRRPAKN